MLRRDFVKGLFSVPALRLLKFGKQNEVPSKDIAILQNEYPVGVILAGEKDMLPGIVQGKEVYIDANKERLHETVDTGNLVQEIAKRLVRPRDVEFDRDEFFKMSEEGVFLDFHEGWTFESVFHMLEKSNVDPWKVYAVMTYPFHSHLGFRISLNYMDPTKKRMEIKRDRILPAAGYRVPVVFVNEMPMCGARRTLIAFLSSECLQIPEDLWHKPGEWRCKYCYTLMNGARVRCEACGEYRSMSV